MKKHGKGTFYVNSYVTHRFEGNFINDKLSGFGKHFIHNRIEYAGIFRDNKYNGPGRLESFGIGSNCYFEGTFKDGLLVQGAEVRHGVKVYEGGFKEGHYHGHGKQF